jgi:Skp family chaperone for outer membrane proteins
MKKLIFSFLTTAAFLTIAATNANAQQPLKIGFFDPNIIVQNLPEFKATVQDKLDQYDRDSLGVAHDMLEQQLASLDSTYKADSAKKVPKAILDVTAQKRQEAYLEYVNWNQYAQRYHQDKLQQLAGPLFTKVMASYKKMKEAKKVTLVLVQDALFQDGEQGAYENLTIDVAKDLGLPVNDNSGGAAAAPPASSAPAKPAAKPAAGKK